MSRALPAWAQNIVPVDMDEAAILLGISRRFLVDVIAKHQHYERRGNRKVFYPEHIALLREAISCRTLSSNPAKAFTTPLEPLPESAYEKALALATRQSQRNSARSTKLGSGNVITMAKRLSEPSKRQP